MNLQGKFLSPARMASTSALLQSTSVSDSMEFSRLTSITSNMFSFIMATTLPVSSSMLVLLMFFLLLTLLLLLSLNSLFLFLSLLVMLILMLLLLCSLVLMLHSRDVYELLTSQPKRSMALLVTRVEEICLFVLSPMLHVRWCEIPSDAVEVACVELVKCVAVGLERLSRCFVVWLFVETLVLSLLILEELNNL